MVWTRNRAQIREVYLTSKPPNSLHIVVRTPSIAVLAQDSNERDCEGMFYRETQQALEGNYEHRGNMEGHQLRFGQD